MQRIPYSSCDTATMTLKEIPRIVTRQDQDGQTIAMGRKNPYRQDHVFEDTHAEGRFGVYISRRSPQALTYSIREYNRFLPPGSSSPCDQIGDLEAVLYFQTSDPSNIPPWFKKSAARIRQGKERGAPHLVQYKNERCSFPPEPA